MVVEQIGKELKDKMDENDEMKVRVESTEDELTQLKQNNACF
jgi:hypothetical protein